MRAASCDYIYCRFVLPSKKMVEIRRVTRGRMPEVVVREVNNDNELSSHEYNLRLDFLLRHGKRVRHI